MCPKNSIPALHVQQIVFKLQVKYVHSKVSSFIIVLLKDLSNKNSIIASCKTGFIYFFNFVEKVIKITKKPPKVKWLVIKSPSPPR